MDKEKQCIKNEGCTDYCPHCEEEINNRENGEIGNN